MANADTRIAEALKLYLVDGLPMRVIAKKLGMSRNTVRRVVGRGVSKRRAPPASPRTSLLTPYEDKVKALIAETPELTGAAVLEKLRADGYRGGISILRDRLRTLRPREAEPFLALDFKPGEAVQVDWADFGFALPGIPRRVSAFVMALCHSRYLYIEFVLSQSMGSLLRRMERGLRFFGGTTHVDIFDNMKTVVLHHHAKGIVFRPATKSVTTSPPRSCAGWRSTAPLSSPPRLGEHANVEVWAAAREEVREALLKDGWSEAAGAFTGAFGSEELDASVLMMPLVGFLPADDPRMRATVEKVERELMWDGLVHRWARDDNGGFFICTYWLVECLALAGEAEHAEALFKRTTAYANDLGLLAEEADGRTRELLGNFPQAFSHIGLINAALAPLPGTGRTGFLVVPAARSLGRAAAPSGGSGRCVLLTVAYATRGQHLGA